MFSPVKLFKRIGPGVITGASDDDPSGIATYSQTGAQFGYGLLWMALFTAPLMTAVQEMTARIGMVSGHGLMGAIRSHTSRRVALMIGLLLFTANTVNIGADLGAMAAVVDLIVPGPVWLYATVFAGLITWLMIRVPYQQYVNLLRWLTLALFSYVITAFVSQVEWSTALLRTLVPSVNFDRDTLLMIVAILGTTISPYLFFWQASEEVEEEIAHKKNSAAARAQIKQTDLRRMRRDVTTGMVFSNLVMFFIIVTAAATLNIHGITTIETAADAAEALRPLAGDASFILFAFGIIGTGLLAIPVLAGSAAYALSEVFGWNEGLSKPFRRARPFYLTLSLAVGAGLLLNGLGLPPLTFLIVAAVVNGLIAPVMLWFIIQLADKPDVVGPHRSPPVIRLAGRITFGAMTLAAVLLLVSGWI